MPERYLAPTAAARVYDRIGRFQDTQGFYERRAVVELIQRSRFEDARAVVEFGCGTGRLAEQLLARHLGPSAHYLGVDVSPRMVTLARERVRPWQKRAEILLTNGTLPLNEPDGSFDRFVACYVLDLFSPEQIAELLEEAARLLSPSGLLCLVSLTHGVSGKSALVTKTWTSIWRSYPQAVGGCRPIELLCFVGGDRWAIEQRLVVTSFAVPSEVLLVGPR
jgi:ubiquinone/menaquinone biosynthesis C-methylase UbiE